MTANELCCRVNDNVRTVLNGTNEIRCAEGIVYHKRQTVLVSKFGKCVDIGNIAIGIAECFDIDGSCVFLDCRLDLGKVMNIYKACVNTEIRKCMRRRL